MATSITTQADVLTNAVIPDNEVARLTTERMQSDNWASIHAKAWTMILGYLAARHPSMEESDLDDTDELIPATCFAVMYLAYQAAQMLSEDDLGRKKYWFRKMRKALATVELTSDSTTLPRESFGSRRALRG